MKTRAHVIISGDVQGVFFRANTRQRAKALGIMGWVRNTPDGKVEAVFEGEKQNIEKMISFCKEGPSAAKVKDIDVNWETYKNEFEGFNIRYE